MKVIKVEKLEKKYNKLRAVDGVSFEVNQGEVFGLLGENGAGKTTTLEIIEGLRRPSSGKIEVLGHDVVRDLKSIKEKIGVQLQSSAYFNYLKLTEIIELFGSFYSIKVNAAELLKMVGLEDKADAFVGQLSGGQKQRFSIVASLVNDPEIVFLDEPTTGLDPLARRRLWDLIVDIKAKGKTIVLTTHYMEEAEMLCDRIAIMEKGKIIAMDNTHKLIEKTDKPFKIDTYVNLNKKEIENLKGIGIVETILGKKNHYEIKVRTQADLNCALGILQASNPESLAVGRANLEDLFIELTGKRIEAGND